MKSAVFKTTEFKARLWGLFVTEFGVPFLFGTPSVRMSFDVSSEMSVFKTATSGSSTSMSSNMNNKVKKRSSVTSDSSMSSGMRKRDKKRSSETSDNSSGTIMSSDISKKAKRRSSGKISNAGNNTSHATNDNSSSGNSTEAGGVSLRSFDLLLVMVLGSKVPTIKDCLKEITHLREKVEAGQVLRAEQILPVMEGGSVGSE